MGNSRWQLLWKPGSGVDLWRDPNFDGWTRKIESPCTQRSTDPDRVVFTVSTKGYVSDVNWWATNIAAAANTIRQKYPNVQQIVLQPVVGGPNNGPCFYNGDQVRATFNHPFIDQAIAQLVGGDVVAGMSPEVRTCADYVDGVGHFVTSARPEIGRIIGEFYVNF